MSHTKAGSGITDTVQLYAWDAPKREKPPKGLLCGQRRRRSVDLRFFRAALYRLSYLTMHLHTQKCGEVAGTTGFEPATSGLTGRRELQASPRPQGSHGSNLNRHRQYRVPAFPHNNDNSVSVSDLPDMASRVLEARCADAPGSVNGTIEQVGAASSQLCCGGVNIGDLESELHPRTSPGQLLIVCVLLC